MFRALGSLIGGGDGSDAMGGSTGGRAGAAERGSLSGARGRAPGGDRAIRPWRRDSIATHPSFGITPARAVAMLHAADAGTPQQQFELFGDMLQKWPRLAAVENTRRLALTGLEWEITPARVERANDGSRTNDSSRALAEEAAAFCRESLERLPSFRAHLEFLANAIGFGISVVEVVWEDGRLIDLTPVPYTRLINDPHEPWRLRVLTEESPTTGIALDEQPHKWLIHAPRATPGRRFSGGMLRASALLFLAQNLSFKDWLAYSQIAGMPMRVAQFEPGLSADDQKKLMTMLESLGTEAVAAFSKNVDLKVVEPLRSSNRLYQQIQEYCNTEVTILWLGQHLTTDIRQSGSRAAAEVHDRVREDLLMDDIHDEGEALRRDLLTPMVQGRFGPEAPVPMFRRSLMQSIDTRALAQTLAVAVNEVGLRVPRDWAHQALGIPVPEASEPVLTRGGE